MVELLHLADDAGRAVLLVIAAESRRIGRTPVAGELLGHPVTTDRRGHTALGRLLVSVLPQEQVTGLAVLSHRARATSIHP
jgi:hypothetical protein